MSPILGSRFHCLTCGSSPDCDLCSGCYADYRAGRITHPLNPPSARAAASHQFRVISGTPASRYSGWLKHNDRSPALPPPVATGLVVRPEFRFASTSAFGGHGVVIRFRSQCLLLTALHVMDDVCRSCGIDAGAHNPHYRPEELPSLITSVRLYDVLRPRWMLHPLGEAGKMLVLAHARTADEEPFSSRDIAAFRIDAAGQLAPGRLAETEPQPGDPVWLVVAMPDGRRARRARVIERSTSPDSFIFRYDDAEEMPKYTSGSALLDKHGSVVGINIGLGKLDGREFGHANPLASIRAHLEGALSAPSASPVASEVR